MMHKEIRTVTATRYITPLREGGTLPAIIEADDGAHYVVKFAGAGHGHKALIAELICGELARALGLRVPEIVLVELERGFGHHEPDPEIFDLLTASAGLNLGLRYLPGAFAYQPLVKPAPPPELASTIVWFDAYVMNLDRTPRNTNLLWWQKQIWLIDHGAALYFHFKWDDSLAARRAPFTLIKDHTLLPFASALAEVDAIAQLYVTPAVIAAIVAQVPDAWLSETRFANPAAHRRAYVEFLQNRLDAANVFVSEAENARARIV